MKVPSDFIKRMNDYLGEEMDSFLASYSCEEVKALRVADEKNIDKVRAQFDDLEPVFIENHGFYYKDSATPGKHPYHEAGAYYIQDASAMSPVVALSVKPGERVLDLCAAPGGKSTQIGAYLKGEGILIANEYVSNRAKILSENIERMGISNALVINEDPRNISGKFEGYFDKILVDAPCSGEGMFRRSETAYNEWSLENVNMCADRQAWILDEAVKMLAPGGRIVYSTCTFSKEENEENALELVKRHDDLRIIDLAKSDSYDKETFERFVKCGVTPGFDNVGYRLWPHKVKGEGHYLCVFEKNSDVSYDDVSDKITRVKNMPAFGYEKGVNKKEEAELKDMKDFLKKNMTNPEKYLDGTFIKFGDNIYLLPKECPSLKGIKVLRAGLHIGSLLKNRFEPAHALFKSLSEDDYRNICHTTLDNDVIYKYFRGETFDLSMADVYMKNENGEKSKAENGFYLVTIDGISCGFSKLTGNILKNHYPKGLRKQL